MSLSSISAAHLFGNEFDKSMQKESQKQVRSRDDSTISKDTSLKLSPNHTIEEPQPSSCSQCNFNFEKDTGLFSKIFKSRKLAKCNKCHELVCNKCCLNKSYVEGFKDEKVAICDRCFKDQQEKDKKKKQIMQHQNSVFKSDFQLSNLERQYLKERQIAQEQMLQRLLKLNERNKFLNEMEREADNRARTHRKSSQ